jgi:hypothetical protein
VSLLGDIHEAINRRMPVACQLETESLEAAHDVIVVLRDRMIANWPTADVICRDLAHLGDALLVLGLDPLTLTEQEALSYA